MLYTITTLATILYLSYGQDCAYSTTDLSGENVGATKFTRGASQQYVVYDYSKLPGSIKGEYFLPYLMTEDGGDTLACHNDNFQTTGTSTTTFECSTGYEDGSEDETTTITKKSYTTTDCTGDVSETVWWEKGYSPWLTTTGDISTMADCSTNDACLALNYTRQEVTQYSGSRFDFSCEGKAKYAEATLCASSPDCDGNLCSTVFAAVGASCIATPNATYANLLVSCKSSTAYLTTYVDITQLTAGNPWNTYTVERSCTDDGTTGYICNIFSVGKTCEEAFTTQLAGSDVTIYGKLSKCTGSFSASSRLTYSIALLLFSAFAVLMNN